jgi:hypothetical protein
MMREPRGHRTVSSSPPPSIAADDGAFSVKPDGTVLGFFDREAPTEQDAVVSAIVDAEQAGIGARMLRVEPTMTG